MAQLLRSHRTDIRLGVIAAITNLSAAPWPTMAEDRVFDSRQDPYIMGRSQDDLPSVTVYTDTNKREPISQGRPPFQNHLEIIIEMSLGGGIARETDAEMERVLDLFEEQVIFSLFDYSGPNANALGSMFKRALSADSMRLANSDSAQRLAMRDLLLVVDYDNRCSDLTQAFPKFERLWMQQRVGTEISVSSRDNIPVA